MKANHIRNGAKALFLVTCLLAVAGCGGDSQSKKKADGEHFLSAQQKALERSKAAAKAMTEAATERARQTEDARND